MQDPFAPANLEKLYGVQEAGLPEAAGIHDTGRELLFGPSGNPAAPDAENGGDPRNRPAAAPAVAMPARPETIIAVQRNW